MRCPGCREEIEDDSNFCDICGEEIFVCVICGQFRPQAGHRFCAKDRGDFKPRRSAEVTAPASSAPPPPPVSYAVAGRPPSPLAGPTHLVLVSDSPPLRLKLRDGDILGRSEGRFRDELKTVSKLSRKHARVSAGPGGTWLITDLKSSNGVTIAQPTAAGRRIPANTPTPLSHGDSIALCASLSFVVSIEPLSTDDKNEK